MSTSITIRNVPDDAHAELVARAARAGQSLQEFLRAELINLASRPDNKELMERIRARKHALKLDVPTDLILSLRDMDRE